MTVRAMLTKEKPYSSEKLQAVHTAIVLHCADTRVIVCPHRVTDYINISSRYLLTLHCATSGLKVKALTELANIID